MKKTILIAIIIATFFSCNKFNIFEKEGEIIQKEIILNDLNELDIQNIFDIELIQSKQNKLIIEAGENIIDRISYSYIDKKLSMNHNYQNITRNYNHFKLKIYCTNISLININAPCKITSKHELISPKLLINIREETQLSEIDLMIKSDYLKMHSYGSNTGMCIFKGKCTEAYFVLNGGINVNSTELTSEKINIAQNSMGDAKICCTKKLNITFYTEGNVHYKGEPEISINRTQINNQSPTGKLIKLP